MEKDTTNYMKYKMGYSQKLLLADETVPSYFHCQEDRKRRLHDAGTSREVFVKRQRKDLIKECEDRKICQNIAETSKKDDNILMHKVIDIEPEELSKAQDKQTFTDLIRTADKSVQVATKVHYRSKSVQTILLQKSISTSPFKTFTISRYTSPFKIETCNPQPSGSGVSKSIQRNIFFMDEKSDSDISIFTETETCVPSSSLASDSGSVSDVNENVVKLQCLKSTIHLIQKKPLMYVGIPKDCYYITHLMHKHTNIKIEYILLCLKKIRMNNTFSELEDNFGISLSYASKLFLHNIPIISSVLQPFIVNLDKSLLKKNLPIVFRQNYHNVSCIIDCLEIDIQKPSKALDQALTWSDYKKSNTVKYLISCTPNGLVNYVSPGFGGRTSDVTLIENCDFLDGLQQGNFILADRGFKHIEQLLHKRGIQLLRPPSIKAGLKLTKEEVRQTKVIASLRIHIERVIRRIREFHMLKQHSVINTNLLRVLDHIIIIACGLINLQDSLIK